MVEELDLVDRKILAVGIFGADVSEVDSPITVVTAVCSLGPTSGSAIGLMNGRDVLQGRLQDIGLEKDQGGVAIFLDRVLALLLR